MHQQTLSKSLIAVIFQAVFFQTLVATISTQFFITATSNLFGSELRENPLVGFSITPEGAGVTTLPRTMTSAFAKATPTHDLMMN